MISTLATRLGLIAFFAVSIFAVGKIVNVISPPEDRGYVAFDQERATGAAPVLDESLFDPVMARVFSEMDSAGAIQGRSGDGATMSFPSPGGAVILSRSDVKRLNARYRSLERSGVRERYEGEVLEDLRRTRLADDGWGSGTSY